MKESTKLSFILVLTIIILMLIAVGFANNARAQELLPLSILGGCALIALGLSRGQSD